MRRRDDAFRIESNKKIIYSCDWLPDNLGHEDGVFSGARNITYPKPDTRPPEIINQEKYESGRRKADVYYNSGCILLPKKYGTGKAERPEDKGFEARMTELCGEKIYSPIYRTYLWQHQ